MSIQNRIRPLIGWTVFTLGYFLLRVLPFTKKQSEYQILIAPPGGGNIGDQAMVESFLQNTTKSTVMVVTRTGDIDIADNDFTDLRTVELKGLIYGNIVSYFFSFIRFISLLPKAETVSIVGADIMDGAYNPEASTSRANIARFATKFGCKAKVLGFSWNGQPASKARHALQNASFEGVELCLRDPLSAERARHDQLNNVVEVADLVFEAKGAAHTDELSEINTLISQQQLDGYVLLNASGLISKKGLAVEEWKELSELLKQRNLLAVVIPHVSRPGGDDIPPCKELNDYLKGQGNNVYLIDRIFSPKEVRGMTKGAKLVITGRMHLAIMSLWNAVPAITLATQGKVDGLKMMFEIGDHSIEPAQGFGAKVASKAKDVLDQHDVLLAKLKLRLGGVKERAKLNFNGL